MTDLDPDDADEATDEAELTRRGLAAKVLGRAQELAGDVLGDDDLEREGRHKQAEAESDHPGGPAST